MASQQSQSDNKPKIIGSPENFWLLYPTGYDLTHPATPTSPPIRPSLALATTTSNITIDPAKTALVIIDMQNFFLSSALFNRSPPHAPPCSPGLIAADRLVTHAIPACRKASIPVIWLNWGLMEQDLTAMPPAILASFARKSVGLGGDLGEVNLHLEAKEGEGEGKPIKAGRALMRGEWNSELYPPLAAAVEWDKDVLVHKNRISGFWGGYTAVELVLQTKGVKTLLFAGVNTDQCVAGSLQDAFAKGYDCLMLSDGCATTSPEFAQRCVEWNCERGWGFVLSCEGLREGVERMVGERESA